MGTFTPATIPGTVSRLWCWTSGSATRSATYSQDFGGVKECFVCFVLTFCLAFDKSSLQLMLNPCSSANRRIAVPGLLTLALHTIVKALVVECQYCCGLFPGRTELAVVELNFVRQFVPHPLDDKRMAPQLRPLWVLQVERHTMFLATAHKLVHTKE